jgi:SAM-dependent methyltransferase
VETTARYDGLADWYDGEFLGDSAERSPTREALVRLLGEGTGRLLDVGCGTGAYTAVTAELGWSPTGVDLSADMLRRARARGLDVVQANAAAAPFADGSFDAAISLWTHTDVDDFAAVLREIARVLRPGCPLVYVGAHPCFVGPHSRFVFAEGVPDLHPGYRATERYTEAPGTSPAGLRARVGATHLPLGLFLQAFFAVGFRLEWLEEDEAGLYPYSVALRCRR